MINKEAIELVEKIENARTVTGLVDERLEIILEVKKLASQALALLEEQPPAGDFCDFMEEVKDEIKKAPKMFHQLQKRDELIKELRARLDASEASRKELLTALKNLLEIDMYRDEFHDAGREAIVKANK